MIIGVIAGVVVLIGVGVAVGVYCACKKQKTSQNGTITGQGVAMPATVMAVSSTPTVVGGPTPTVMAASAGPNFCPNCGAAVVGGAKFCVSCGNPIDGAISEC